MNILCAVKIYVEKMIREAGPGMKIILLDSETTGIISMAFSQSEMLQKEVYLFERIDSTYLKERLKYLKCIVFVRPTKKNITLLTDELRTPKFGLYYIYFSNIIPRTDIKMLAENDESESVREIKELYADYLGLNSNLFSFNIPFCMEGLAWIPKELIRSLQGLTSILLSLKFNPVIRYRAGSVPAQQLAKKLHDHMMKESSLFDFGRCNSNGSPPPLLLILDRRDDPVTPLLHQWTYQAMVHELLTINNNRVDLSKVKGVPKDLREVVLSAEQDDFFLNNMYSTFGEIGTKIKVLMEEFQRKTKDQLNVESISDMQNFVDSYPQFRKMSGTLTKHICVVGELSNLTSERMLFDVSELEQEIACKADHSSQLLKIKTLVGDERISLHDALKLIALYSLRYEKHSNCDTFGLLQTLRNRGGKTIFIPRLIEYAGQHIRQGELFNSVKIHDAVKITRNLIKGLKGVENVFTQHNCLLKEILEDTFKGRDLDPSYPTICSDIPSFRRPPCEVICFIIGGVTYEEALVVQQLNNSGYKIILGGTTVHNSQSFINEILQATSGISFKHTKTLEKFHMSEEI